MGAEPEPKPEQHQLFPKIQGLYPARGPPSLMPPPPQAAHHLLPHNRPVTAWLGLPKSLSPPRWSWRPGGARQPPGSPQPARQSMHTQTTGAWVISLEQAVSWGSPPTCAPGRPLRKLCRGLLGRTASCTCC